MALLLLVAAGCGGDGNKDVGLGGGPGRESAAPVGDVTAAGGNGGIDPCSLLDAAEVQAQFGERGAVADGQSDFASCVWDVGDQTQEGSGDVYVTGYPPAGGSGEEQFASVREMTDNPVGVEGLGDEAFLQITPLEESPLGVLETTIVTVRHGDLVLDVGANFGPPSIPDAQDKLVALAELVLQRL